MRRLNWQYATIWAAAAVMYFGVVVLIGQAVS